MNYDLDSCIASSSEETTYTGLVYIQLAIEMDSQSQGMKGRCPGECIKLHHENLSTQVLN